MDCFAKIKDKVYYEQLYSLLNINEYRELVIKVNELEVEGEIEPITKYGFNDKEPRLYKRYKVIKEKGYETYKKTLDEIEGFSVYLKQEYYLQNPKEYKKDCFRIKQLDSYLRKNVEELSIPISIKERSFEIWGDENYLESIDAQRLLANLGLKTKFMNTYNTPDPFFYYVNDIDIPTVLIIENKDTWFTVRRILQEGQKSIFGYEIGLIIYGEEEKILKSINFIDIEFPKLKNYNLYYWGDLDLKGVSIFNSLKKVRNVKLFANAYKHMVDTALAIEAELKFSNEDKKLYGGIDCLEEVLGEEQFYQVINVFKEYRYIPQEILNYKYIKE